MADQVEKNNNGNDDLAHIHAYSMLVLFEGVNFNGTINNSMDYIQKCFPEQHDKKIIHDAFAACSLPLDGKAITLAKWRELVKKHGSAALKLFAIADQIEIKKAEKLKKTGVPIGAHLAPDDLTDAEQIKALLTYPRAEEDELLAELCLNYNVKEKVFNRCLELNKQRKTKDNLPDVAVNGLEVEKDGYWLVKLPIDDPRSYILGKITNCCQSIGGDSEECVIDGVTRENNGFYVLLHRAKGRKRADSDKRKDISVKPKSATSSTTSGVDVSLENLPLKDGKIYAQNLMML